MVGEGIVNYFYGTVAFSTNGVKAVTVGFQAIGYRLTIGEVFGGTDNFVHMSVGGTDGTDHYCNSTYKDNTGGLTRTVDNRVISHFERVAGALTEIMEASHDSITATQIKFNMLLANIDYNIQVEAWG